jgi:hypothetical protein
MRIGYAAAIANDLDRDEEARLQVCWAHHRLCLGAGSGHRQRPSRALLSAQRAQLSQLYGRMTSAPYHVKPR